MLYEFTMRMSLRKVGVSCELSELSAYKAECFGIIAGELAACQEEEMKKGRRRR